MRCNGNDPNSRDRKGEDTNLYKKSYGWNPEFGHGNGHVEMTRKSGTEFIATPEEPTRNYPKLRKRDEPSIDNVDDNNNKDSDNTSSNILARNTMKNHFFKITSKSTTNAQ